MRTLLFLSVLLTVAWGIPFKPKEPQAPPPETLQQPLVGNLLPAQGHVILENPAPQPELGKEPQLLAPNPDNNEQEAKQIQQELVEVPAEASEVHVEPPLNPDLTEDNNEIEQVDAAAPFEEVSLESDGKEELPSDLESKVEMLNNDIVEDEEKEPLQELDVHNDIEAKYNFEQPVMKLEPNEEPNPEMINYFVKEEEKETLHELEDNDLEAKYNFEQPNMYLEPLNDQEMQRDELLAAPDTHHTYEEPLMHLEPETFENSMPYAAIAPEKDGPVLDPMGQPMQNIAYPEEDGPMLDPYGQPLERVPYAYAAIAPEEEQGHPLDPMGQPMQNIAYPGEDGPMLDPMGQPMHRSDEYTPLGEGAMWHKSLESEGGQSQMLQPGEPRMQGRRSCSGVVLEGKCFQFFPHAKRASEAEYFCQQHFPEGHLASITCPYVHKQMMNLMRQNGGTRRTWVGGIRFLDTGRFVWLDGSHWAYADWLSGEPNNTSGKEDCIEVLASGKFNDFTCWEPQAFICSYPYE